MLNSQVTLSIHFVSCFAAGSVKQQKKRKHVNKQVRGSTVSEVVGAFIFLSCFVLLNFEAATLDQTSCCSPDL